MFGMSNSVLRYDFSIEAKSPNRRIQRASARPQVRQPDFFTTLPKARSPVFSTTNSLLSCARIPDFFTTIKRTLAPSIAEKRNKYFFQFYRQPSLDPAPSSLRAALLPSELSGFLQKTRKFWQYILQCKKRWGEGGGSCTPSTWQYAKIVTLPLCHIFCNYPSPW